VVKPDLYSQRNEEPVGLDMFRRASRSRSRESRGPMTERPMMRNPQSSRGMYPITPNARYTARNPNKYMEQEVIRGPEIIMKITNEDIDANKSRLRGATVGKTNLANLQTLMNQTPNDALDPMYMKKRDRIDS
jgi:hypothetical protein